MDKSYYQQKFLGKYNYKKSKIEKYADDVIITNITEISINA